MEAWKKGALIGVLLGFLKAPDSFIFPIIVSVIGAFMGQIYDYKERILIKLTGDEGVNVGKNGEVTNRIKFLINGFATLGGLWIILLSLITFLESLLSGIFMLLAGLLILPLSWRFIIRKTNLKVQALLRIRLFLIAIFFVISSSVSRLQYSNF